MKRTRAELPRAATPAAPARTYSVGDYVWTEDAIGMQVARIERATPKVKLDGDWWMVRARCDDGVWTTPHLRRVLYALSPVEKHAYRKAGVLPPAGKTP